jgi:hypothetical protein
VFSHLALSPSSPPDAAFRNSVLAASYGDPVVPHGEIGVESGTSGRLGAGPDANMSTACDMRRNPPRKSRDRTRTPYGPFREDTPPAATQQAGWLAYRIAPAGSDRRQAHQRYRPSRSKAMPRRRRSMPSSLTANCCAGRIQKFWISFAVPPRDDTAHDRKT